MNEAMNDRNLKPPPSSAGPGRQAALVLLSGLAVAEAGRIARPALVWFHAHWCHVCQEIRPDMSELAQAYGDQLALITMNVDHADSQASAARYRVSDTPTFVLFDAHGRVLDRFAGWPGRQAMEDLLDRATAPSTTALRRW